MGAGSRKINNARSQALYDTGQNIYRTGNELAANPFAPGEEAGLRSRALRPIQAAYAGATRYINRAKSLGTSGSSGSSIAAMAKLNRDRTQQLSDATMDINTGILGERFNRSMQARQYGLQGLGVSSNAPKNEGFGFGKLFGGLATLGSGFLTRPQAATT